MAGSETRHSWIAVSVQPLLPEAAARIEALPTGVRLSDAMNALADVMANN